MTYSNKKITEIEEEKIITETKNNNAKIITETTNIDQTKINNPL